MPRLAPALVALVLFASPALPSTDEAWAAFRADVATACMALVTQPGTVTIEVNPFGSQTYGAALVTVTAEGTAERMVCVYDKAAKTAELTAAF